MPSNAAIPAVRLRRRPPQVVDLAKSGVAVGLTGLFLEAHLTQTKLAAMGRRLPLDQLGRS